MTFTDNIKDLYRTGGYWVVVFMLVFWLFIGEYWDEWP